MILSRISNFYYPGVGITLLVIVMAWMASYTAPFVILQGALYDQMVEFSLPPSPQQSNVLLIQVPLEKSQSGDEYWLALFNELKSHQPSSITVNFFPENVTPLFYDEVSRFKNTFFTRHLIMGHNEGSRLTLTPIPKAAAELELAWAVKSDPPISYGVTRYQYAYHTIANQQYPALENRIAQSVNLQTTDESYLVNFMQGESRIPKVTAERVLNHGIIPKLIENKHVIIGLSSDIYLKGLHTPVTGGEQQISLLEFQGYALNTLLEKSAPIKSNLVITLSIITLIASISLLLYQSLNLKLATWVTIGIITLYLFISWLTLSLLLFWLPTVEMISAQIMMLLTVYRYKVVQEEKGLRDILLKNKSELQEKLIPSNFFDSKEHWAQVINLVNQTLDLTRVIFLERVPNDHRLREIRALNCSLESIVEMRRDYERTPYSTAIEENGPILLERTYLEEIEEQEDQYLVPLLFTGDVLGFWAFGIHPDKAAAIPMFISRVRDYGQQIAELLYHRQQWQQQHDEQGQGVQKYLEFETGSKLYKALRQTNELSQRRVKSLEQVFNGLGTATILYDLFGGLIQINQQMIELLKQLKLPIYEMTALDLMSSITDLDKERARHVLRYIVLEHGNMSLPLNIEGENAMMLNIKPLLFNKEKDTETASASAFQLMGILFELVDVTYYQKMYQLQETLVDRLNIQIRNDMQSLVMATNLLSKEDIPDAQRKRALDIVNEKVDLTVEIMKEAQQHLSLDLATAPLERYPIDVYPPIHKAIASNAEKAALRKITINSDIDRIIGLVFAEPAAMQMMVEALLSLLIDDAVEGSEICIRSTQVAHEVALHFSNTGFGIPAERMQELVFGCGEIRGDEFRKLRDANAFIQKWEGSFAAQSEVGEGMNFKIKLRAFL